MARSRTHVSTSALLPLTFLEAETQGVGGVVLIILAGYPGLMPTTD